MDAAGTRSVGAGFLVEGQRVLTCAHVVDEAVGRNGGGHPPRDDVVVEFPMLPGRPRVKAFVHPSGWLPIDEGGGDIALLALRRVPDGLVEAPIARTNTTLNHPYRTYGFPITDAVAIESSGLIRGWATRDWITLEASATSTKIEPGYSGAPVWDDEVGGVVGMVVADVEGLEGPAFMIGLPVVGQVVGIASSLSRRDYVKKDGEGTYTLLMRCASMDLDGLSSELCGWLERQDFVVLVEPTQATEFVLHATRKATVRFPFATGIQVLISCTNGELAVRASTDLSRVLKRARWLLQTSLVTLTTAGVTAAQNKRIKGVIQRLLLVAEYYAYSPALGKGQEPADMEPE